MTSKRDDDALSWAGDDDPTLAAGQAPAERESREPEPLELPDGWSVPVASEAVAPRTAATPAAAAERPAVADSAALVGMGILAGIYLLYTVGWFIGASRIGEPVADPVARFMFSLGAWVAVAAPLLWFGATFWLTSRPRVRFLWLIVGVVLLAPLPFVVGAGRTS
jgi:hypothetical protein